MSVRCLENFIGGEFVSCSRHVESFCPATGEVHLQVPDSGEEEVELAVRAAEEAFKTLARCMHTDRYTTGQL